MDIVQAIHSSIIEHLGYDGVAFFTIAFVVLIGYCMILMAREIAYWKADHTLALGYIGDTKKRGIYRIRCRVNAAEYIGSTKANFMARWGQHIRDLNKGKHTSPGFQADWNQYGPHAFQFMIIEVMDDDHEIIVKEREMLIQRAATLPPVLNYNVANSRVYPVPSSPEEA